MMTQINIDSLFGLAGKKAQHKALEFLQAGLVHFLASDTHPGYGRMPPDKAAIDRLYELVGKETTTRALKSNPLDLLAGKKVDPLRSDGIINLNFSAQLHAWQGGYMQRLKNLFMNKKNSN